jgi:hypothetical protein
MEATNSSETSLDFQGLSGVKSQKTGLFISPNIIFFHLTEIYYTDLAFVSRNILFTRENI